MWLVSSIAGASPAALSRRTEETSIQPQSASGREWRPALPPSRCSRIQVERVFFHAL